MYEISQSRSQAEATYLEQLQALGWRALSIEPSRAEQTDGGPSFERVELDNEMYDWSFNNIQSDSLIFYEQGDDTLLVLRFFQANSDTAKLQIDLIDLVSMNRSLSPPQSSSEYCTFRDHAASPDCPKVLL